MTNFIKTAGVTEDIAFAKKSLGEEEAAIRDYTKFLKSETNPFLRKVTEHALGEEKDHAKGFREAIAKLEKGAGENRYLQKVAAAGQKKQANPQTELRPHTIRALKKLDETGGLVVDHGMGSGKTLLMLKAIEKAQARDKKNNALAIVPASLVSNMDKEIAKFHLNVDTKRLTVLSYDKAVNQASELRKKHHSIVVMDEAHRMRNTGTQRHKELREIVENADQRILASGTTRYNHISDMAPLINMAARKKVLPEDKKQFEAEFVDRKTTHPGLLARIVSGAKPEEVQTLKNNKYLKKVLDEHVDYYNIKDDPESAKHFPTHTDRVIEVPMSSEQKAAYKYMEGKLPFHLRMKVRMNLPLDKKESANLNAFSSGVRQVSNTAAPYMPNLQGASPKIKAMVDSLESKHAKNKNHRSIVYSNYMDAGLSEYSRELSARGIKHDVYHGGLSKAKKDEIRDAYNNGKLPVMLISSSGAEGLDLKGTRLVQIMEPHQNASKINQVIARGIRFKSHDHLPESQRNVAVERYHSIMPKTMFGKGPTTIDTYLHHNSATKDDLNDQVSELMKS